MTGDPQRYYVPLWITLAFSGGVLAVGVATVLYLIEPDVAARIGMLGSLSVVISLMVFTLMRRNKTRLQRDPRYKQAKAIAEAIALAHLEWTMQAETGERYEMQRDPRDAILVYRLAEILEAAGYKIKSLPS
jgi:hypothetical protein